MAKIAFRWVEGNQPEMEAVQAIIEEKGWTPLNFPTSRAYCAFDGDSLIGFIVLQLFPHTEPLFVADEYRGTGVTEELVDGMASFMEDVRARGFICIADSPFAEKLCQSWGMKRIESPVYLMPEGKA